MSLADLTNQVDITIASDKSPLHLKCESICDNITEIEELILSGVDVNSQLSGLYYNRCLMNTPLHLLCEHPLQNVFKIKLLLEHGANPNIKNITGDTPLHIICHSIKYMILHYKIISNAKEIKYIIELFLIHNANPNIIDIYRNQTPLHILCCKKIYCPEHIGIIKLLLDNGADPNITDYQDNTSLHYVIQTYMYPVIFDQLDLQEQIKIKINILILLLNYPRIKIPSSGPLRDEFYKFKSIVRDLNLIEAIDTALNWSWLYSPRCIFITAALTLGEVEAQASPFIMDLRQKALL
jgi:hypothetical protein